MEERELRELVGLFEKSDLSVMEIEKTAGGVRVRMEKGGAPAAPAGPVDAGSQAAKQPERELPLQAGEAAGAAPVKAESSSFDKVKAPIVGVFYEAPAPGEEPFVREGQKVEAGQTLCLIEAMKMMNELKAPKAGVVRRVLGKNGCLVEFGQVLYEVETC